jgi:hypothetical protein
VARRRQRQRTAASGAPAHTPRRLSTEELRAEFFARVRDPRAVPILARHAIPVIGVFVFHWSVLETIAALLMDALSTLWSVAGMGAYLAVRDTTKSPKTGVTAALRFWASVVLTFVFVGGILSLFVVVPAMFLLPLVQSAHLDPTSLVTSGWLQCAFAAMLVCQLPGVVKRVRDAEAAGIAPEKMGMDKDVGFIAHRTVLLGVWSSMLAIFGPYALHVLVIVAQAFGAGSEIMRDRYETYVMGMHQVADG